jgi:hypothetical protein
MSSPGRDRVSRASARFFLDWGREQKSRIHLANARQQEEVLAYLTGAESTSGNGNQSCGCAFRRTRASSWI